MALRIDADSHFFPRTDFGDLTQLLPGLSEKAAEMVIRDALVFSDPDARQVGFRAKAEGKGETRPAPISPQRPAGRGSFREAGLSDVEERAKLLPQTGFDMQVLIPHGIFGNPFGSPVGRAMDQGIRLAICKAYNNAAAAAQRQFPDRLIGTAVVPFGDVAESTKEAARAVKELGLRAVTISGNWMGKDYDSIELYPFWETMNALNVPLYVHHNPFTCQIHDHLPSTYTLGWERLRRLHISNYLGFGFEYMMALASLTLGGVLKEFPKLKFCFFEAGGTWLPWALYTLDRTFRVEPQCARITVPPSEYIRASCWVAVEPDEFCLPQAVAAIGSENFIIGSDYPHSPSTYPNTAAGIEKMPGLSDRDKENILGANIAAVLQIS